MIPISTKDKKPLCKWKEYQTRFPTDTELHDWFDNQNAKERGLALVTGKLSQIVVIDIDDKTGNDYGYESTIWAKSGGGGLHFFYKWNDKKPIENMAKVNGEPVDVRGEGGYIIIAPSGHPSGGVYEWKMKDLWSGFQNLPIFNLELKQEKPIKQNAKKYEIVNIASGSRNDNLYRFGCSIVEQNKPQDTINAMTSVNRTYNPPLEQEELTIVINQVLKHSKWKPTAKGKTTLDLKNELVDRKQREQNAPSTGYRQLDDIIKGFIPSHLYTFTGETNAGKTTVAVNWTYNVSKQGHKVLYISLEPDIAVVDMLEALKNNKPYSELRPDDIQGVDNVEIMLQGDCQSFEELSRVLDENVDRYSLIVIDHIGYFITNSDNYIQEQSKLLKQLALKTKSSKTAILLIAHPRKRNNTEKVLDMNDIAGSSAFKQDSTEVLILHRETIIDPEGGTHQSNEGYIYVEKTKVSTRASSNRAKLYFTQGSPKVTGGSLAEELLGNI